MGYDQRIYPGMPRAERDKLDEDAALAREGRALIVATMRDESKELELRLKCAKWLSDLSPPSRNPAPLSAPDPMTAIRDRLADRNAS